MQITISPTAVRISVDGHTVSLSGTVPAIREVGAMLQEAISNFNRVSWLVAHQATGTALERIDGQWKLSGGVVSPTIIDPDLHVVLDEAQAAHP